MRTGLVILGGGFTVLGAGLVVALFFLSGGTTSTTVITPSVAGLTPNANATLPLLGPSSGSSTVTLTWTATAPADVSLWVAMTCPTSAGLCPVGTAPLSWTQALTGKGSVSSANAPGYLLVITNPGTSSLGFTGTISLSYSSGSSVSPWIWGLIATGGIALLVVGGIALFLGFFLPSGVYQDPDAGPRAVRHPSLPPDEPRWNPEHGPDSDDNSDAGGELDPGDEGR